MIVRNRGNADRRRRGFRRTVRGVETEIIYCGDNLEVLDTYVPAKSVDLIYIDPPFNSNRQYEVFWGEASEKRAFADRFGNVQFYIDWMRPRIHQLYRVLKPGGSFYYHCDAHASHYIKALLDDVFGFNAFVSEIIWERATAHHDSKKYRAVHDTILFYAKGKPTTFNRQFGPYSESYIKSHYNLVDKHGRKYQLGDLTASELRTGTESDYEWKGHRPPTGGHWRYSRANMEKLDNEGRIYYTKTGRPRYIRYLDEMPGIALGDVWTDIDPVNSQAKQRQGFPTQKPMPLMERIVKTSSNAGDVILDAFCGCGTTIEAAAKNKRRWVGIDLSPTACKVISDRLERLGLREDQDFRVANRPKTSEDLQRMPHFEFQNWACLALGGFSNAVKSGDFGIDGRVYPADVPKKAQGRESGKQGRLFAETWYPIQVKQKAKAGRPDIDSFETALRRDKRTRGYFVAFDFSPQAQREIKRANRDDGLDIIPITVADLLKYDDIVA